MFHVNLCSLKPALLIGFVPVSMRKAGTGRGLSYFITTIFHQKLVNSFVPCNPNFTTIPRRGTISQIAWAIKCRDKERRDRITPLALLRRSALDISRGVHFSNRFARFWKRGIVPSKNARDFNHRNSPPASSAVFARNIPSE